MRRKLRRIGALALVIAMLLSMFAESLAANEPQDGASTPSSTANLDPKSHYDAASDNTGKPRLYVDFLGDNTGHNSAGTDTANGALVKPENVDFSTATGEGNWEKYTDNPIYYTAGDATIFYVGVGIDRAHLLKALEDDAPVTGADGTTVTYDDAGGVYSFEAAFYYNPRFVEPYAEDGDYVNTIERINLDGIAGSIANSNDNAHWDGDTYRVVEALTGLDPQFDGGSVVDVDLNGDGLVDEWGELTQEVITNPTNAGIESGIWSNGLGWKMTYVSIEMTADALKEALETPTDDDARLEGVYGNTVTYNGEETTEYLLIIPFVLKQYDNANELCFRLVRNATHFTLGSMGGSEASAESPDGGNINYAAWERVTTRNSDSNLKLQTTFTGDLNIFKGEKAVTGYEYTYTAELRLENGGKESNTADVRITNDPSPNPVHINFNREVMTGLSGGTGLTVRVEPQSRYKVTVNVYLKRDTSANPTPLATLNPTYDPAGVYVDTEYTFIMPEADVIIDIKFTLDPDAPRNYDVTLIEHNRLGNDVVVDDSPVGRPDDVTPEISGNITSITAKAADSAYSVTIDSTTTDPVNSNGPYVTAETGTTVEIVTKLHHDYYAEIRFFTIEDVSFAPDTRPTGSQLTLEGDVWVLRVYDSSATGNKYTFDMRATDVEVEVSYRYAPQHEALLEVVHVDENGKLAAINELNRAQLSTVGYDDDDKEERRYGNVQRDSEDENYFYSISPDTVVTDAGNIYPVPIAASTVTGSISGDKKPATAYTENDKLAQVSLDPISARAGREVRVAVEASSAYVIAEDTDSFGNTVDRVVVVSTAPSNTGSSVFFYADKDPDYSNIYTFTMPDYPVRVEVYYTLRTAPSLTLKVDDVAGAAVKVEANTYSENSIYPQIGTITQNNEVMENVLAGGTATVTLTAVPDDYTAKVIVVTDRGNYLVATVPSSAAQLTSGAQVTFTMPNEDATVNITFVKDAETEHTAYIFVTGIDGSLVAGSDAYFSTKSGQSKTITGPAGTALPGVIRVPAGYYIHAVTAVGASTAYPFTQSGNGWANGAATDVYINSSMPDEDIFITAIIKKGPPPVDPSFALSLYVNDDENTAKVDNYATMRVDATNETDGTERVKVADYAPLPDNVYYASVDTEYLNAGTVVYVHVNTVGNFYVQSVTTSPGYLGVDIEWVSADVFRFTMPTTSLAVTVNFAEFDPNDPDDPDDPDEYTKQLTVDKTENGVADSGENSGNTVTSIKYTYLSDNKEDTSIDIEFDKKHPTENPVDMRSTVEAKVSVAAGWYVSAARLVYNGYTYYLTLPANTSANFTLIFTMPTVDAELILDYREGTQPTDGEHLLTIIVDDPYNIADDVDNYASLLVDHLDGSADTPIGPVGYYKGIISDSDIARVGDKVTISWTTAAGYSLELIAINAEGKAIAPQYVSVAGKTTATFTMPDADTTVLVRFTKGAERLYRADLVIYDPDDTANIVDNRASFKPLGADSSTDLYILGDYVYSLHAGDAVTTYIEAVDGYYIDSVTVTPYSTGVTTTLSGAFGKHTAAFNMPASDVQVNVTFRKAWPSDPDDPYSVAKFDVLLTVVDQTMNTAANYAHSFGTGATDTSNVVGGETRIPVARLADGQIGTIHTHRGSRSYVEKVEIYDAAGNEVDWWWSSRYANTIEFNMPPTDIEVIVTYKTVGEGEDLPNYDATLHVIGRNSAAGEAKLTVVTQDESTGDLTDTTRTTNFINVTAADPENSATINDILTGELLRITVTPPAAGSDYIVSSVYAISGDTMITLFSYVTGGGSLVAGGNSLGGGSATFSMPMADVDVYVVFDKALEPYQAIANLEVAGPVYSGANGPVYSGSAELLEWNGDDPKDPNDTLGLTSTGTIYPVGSGYIVLGEALTARVDITPAAGHAIKSVTVVDRDGNPVEFDWILGDDTEYTVEGEVKKKPLAAIEYQQPFGGSWVKVEFEPIDTDRTYTARVVVNNGGDAGNAAAISMGATVNWVKLIDPAQPNEIVDLQITCVPGYRFDITVLPQSHNIHPTLTDRDTISQVTGFLMPADDVIVYVRFEADTRTRYNATLSVYGDVDGLSSSATLQSDFSGSKNARVGSTVSVQALPNEEWITVTPHPATGEYLKSVTVQTVSGIPVLYQIDENGRIRFPMAGEDVEIAVTFSKEQPTYSVRLYAIATPDFVSASNGTATITRRSDNTSASKDALYSELGVPAEINGVTAGETIGVTANLSPAALASSDTYYIDSAYAEYRDGPYKGQRIALTVAAASYLAGFGEYEEITDAWFIMQPYDIDVYVRYGKVEDNGAPAERNIKLEIYGAEGSGTASLVGGKNDILGLDALPTGRAAATTAHAGDQMVMTVVVNAGYEIDYISVTRIGLDLKWQEHTYANGTHVYIFEMPDEDVTIQVHLRSLNTTGYTAYLHVLNVGSSARAEIDTADLRYMDGTVEHLADGDGSSLKVPEAQSVDVRVYINNPNYYVLSAYVLTKTGAMVRLYGDTLEDVALNTALLKSQPEATANFIMPASDVDVYITITDIEDLPDDWTTVALVATDSDMAGTLTNTGARTAVITEDEEDHFLYEIDYAAGKINALSATAIDSGNVPSTGNAGHKAYIVEVDGSDKRINLNEGSKALAPDYEFSPPATLTSSGIQAPELFNATYLPYYSYYYTMPVDDTVTRMHYVKTDVKAADLRVEIIDGENPSDNTVTNSVTVDAAGKPTLNLSSVTSAGAWQVIPSVLPGGSVTFVVNPEHKEDAIVVVTLIDESGNAAPIALTANSDGTYSGSFEMPRGNMTLRVEIAYSSVTLTIYDYNAVNKTVSTLWIPTLEQGITVPVGSTPLVSATAAATAASEGLSEVMTAAELSGAEIGDTTQTLSGVANNTLTETRAELPSDSVLVGIVGTNESGQKLLDNGDTDHYDFRTYGESEVAVIVEPIDADNPRYPVVLNLINATESEKNGASVVNSAGSHYGGTHWTTAHMGDDITVTFTVDSGRTATVEFTGPNGVKIQLPSGLLGSVHAVGTNFTFEVIADAGESLSPIQLDVTYHEPPKLSFAVLDTTGVYDASGTSNNIASITTQSGTDAAVSRTPTYTSNGSVHNGVVTVGGVEATWALSEGDTVNVSATAVNGRSNVVKIYYETSAGITDITDIKSFTMPDEDTTAWVVFGDKDGRIPDPTDPENRLYTATLVVNTEDSSAGWAEAGNSLTALINSTDLTAAGGNLWKTASEGDEIRGTFTVADGWYATVEVKDSNGDVPFIRQTASSELVIVEQPSDDIVITVTFFEITPGNPEPTSSHTLYFSIIGHDYAPGNTATLTLNGVTVGGNDVNPKTLAGNTAKEDPEIYEFETPVPYGTQLELQAGWGDGYSIKKITVELRDDDDNILAAYTVAGSEYNNLITAWMSMPNVDAYVCVYYSNAYTATLHYAFQSGGTGRAEMYDAADKAGTVVTADGEKIENLSGGETIRTEPEAYGGSRLVNVVYETKLTGAHLTTAKTYDLDGDGVTDDYHDFSMPEEDTDVYVVFEPEDGISYIAAVTLEGETAVAGNDATIENVSRASAVGTQYWTTAQSGDTIEITVSLAAGYQAKVTAVYPDDNNALDGSTRELYVTRTLFRLDGEVSSFTMPARSDAIVTIEFIKGYTAELILKDSSGVSNSASMTGNSTTVDAVSDTYGNVTYTKGTLTETVNFGDEPKSSANKIPEIGIGTQLDGNVVVGSGAKLYQLLYTTETGGTFSVDTNRLLRATGAPSVPTDGTAATVGWLLEALKTGDPVEDVTITAVVVKATDNPLIAKVQLEGDSDINGNSAYIVDTDTTGSWLTGNIWTTTEAANIVETNISLAPGYSALITVINDNLYYEELDAFKKANAAALASGALTEADAVKYARNEARMSYALIENGSSTVASKGESLSASKDGAIVRVTMPSGSDASDITVILEFNGEPGPRPYAPNNVEYSYNGTTYLEQGWIYGTNHGDYATITVPTLFTDVLGEGALDILDDVYRPDDPETAVNDLWSNLFRISVWVESVQNFVDLGTNELIFTPVNEPVEYADYPYNVGMFYQGYGAYDAANNGATANDNGYKYNGAMFNVELAELPAGTTPSAAYTAFADILAGDNGSYSTLPENPGTLLQIYAVSSDGRVSDPTQLVIPPYYSLEGTIVSYAPMHDATFTLYSLVDRTVDANGAVLTETYSTEPHTVATLEQDYGDGKWLQNFAIRSSDLGGRSRNSVKNDLAALVGDTATGAYSSPTDPSPTYKLTIEKAAVVTYEREGIVLEIAGGVAVGGYDDGNTQRSWILGREVAAEDAADAEAAAYSIAESASPNLSAGDDSYATGDDTGIYSVGEDASAYTVDASASAEDDGVYPIREDVAVFSLLSEGTALAEETAPTNSTTTVVRDMIFLITGDIDGDGLVIHIDQNILYYYINHREVWTVDVEGGAGWNRSVLNPQTEAYRCDINGDGYINSFDLAAFYDENYNRSKLNYGSPRGTVRQAITAVDTLIASFLSSVDGSDMSEFLPPDEPTETLPPSPLTNEEPAPSV